VKAVFEPDYFASSENVGSQPPKHLKGVRFPFRFQELEFGCFGVARCISVTRWLTYLARPIFKRRANQGFEACVRSFKSTAIAIFHAADFAALSS